MTVEKQTTYDGGDRRRRRRQRSRMRKFRIDFVACVDRPAQTPALAVIMKRRDDADVAKVLPTPNEGETRSAFVSRFMGNAEARSEFPDTSQRAAVANRQFDKRIDPEATLRLAEGEALLDFLKRRRAEDPEANLAAEALLYGRAFAKGFGTPVMTGVNEGHTHLVWLHGDRGGETTMQISEDEDTHHDHPWVIDDNGNIVIGENEGHTHTIDQAAVLAAMREQLIEAGIDGPVVDVVFANSADDEVAKLETPDDVAKAIDAGEVFVKSAAPGVALPDGSWPIRCGADLAVAVEAFSATTLSKARVASHIARRARVLGLASELPAVGELADQLAKADGPAVSDEPEEDRSMSKTDTTPSADERVAQLEAELAVTKSMATLTDRQRAHHATLEGDAASAFLAKNVADRDAELDEIAKGDPVVYTAADGTTYRKSDDARMVAMAKRSDQQAAELAKARTDSANATFAKRASEEFGHLTGEEADKVALLKAVSTIEDDEARGRVEAILKSHDRGIAKAFETRGTKAGGDGANATQQLDAIAKKLQNESAGTDTPLSYVDAYAKAAEANPELYEEAVVNG